MNEKNRANFVIEITKFARKNNQFYINSIDRVIFSNWTIVAQ